MKESGVKMVAFGVANGTKDFATVESIMEAAAASDAERAELPAVNANADSTSP